MLGDAQPWRRGPPGCRLPRTVVAGCRTAPRGSTSERWLPEQGAPTLGRRGLHCGPSSGPQARRLPAASRCLFLDSTPPPLATHPLPCPLACASWCPIFLGPSCPGAQGTSRSVLHTMGRAEPLGRASLCVGGSGPRRGWASAQEWSPRAQAPSWVTVPRAAWPQVKGFCPPW